MPGQMDGDASHSWAAAAGGGWEGGFLRRTEVGVMHEGRTEPSASAFFNDTHEGQQESFSKVRVGFADTPFGKKFVLLSQQDLMLIPVDIVP